MTTASNAPVLAPEVTAGGVAWYVWVFAGSIILAIVGYATWEWREEIQGMVLKIKKMSLAEKRATMHGVQTYLSDEDYEQLMLTKIKTKKSCEEILRDALKQYIQAFK
jgi:hypothetical protein